MNLLTEFRKTIRHFQKQYHEHDENAPILRVQGISMRYDSGMALDSVSFAIERGVRLAIVGPNGAGKSTLIKIVAGVMEPTSGQIQVHGNEPVQHICIGYVPQRSQVDWGFPVSVKDVVMMGRIGKMGLFRNPNRQDHEISDQALETVGLQNLAKRQIGQLSGGQQQRMFIARALAQQAQLLLMDEPFTGLDVNSREDIFNILDRLSSQRVTVLVSLHDLNLAAAKFDQVVLLKKKLLAFGEPETALSSQNLLTAYGSQLHLVDTNGGRLAIEDSCCGEEGHQHD